MGGNFVNKDHERVSSNERCAQSIPLGLWVNKDVYNLL